LSPMVDFPFVNLGMPGDNFVVRHKFNLGLIFQLIATTSREEQPGNPFPVVTLFYPPSNIIYADSIRRMASCEDGPHPILTVVGMIYSSPHSSVSEIPSILL